jgi:hypothetical protein
MGLKQDETLGPLLYEDILGRHESCVTEGPADQYQIHPIYQMICLLYITSSIRRSYLHPAFDAVSKA